MFNIDIFDLMSVVYFCVLFSFSLLSLILVKCEKPY